LTAPGCLDPDQCPVPNPGDVDLRKLRLAHLPAGDVFHTAYSRAYWPALFNPSGLGNARFSPLEAGGVTVPTLYGGRTQTVALLETCFHSVHEVAERTISESIDLKSRGVVALTSPKRLPLIDLTNNGLARVGVSRSQLVSTTPEHYACTREWAVALHARRIGPVMPVGLLWDSRIAELATGHSRPLLEDVLPLISRVFVLFGDRVPTSPAEWHPGVPQYDDLVSGLGRTFVDDIAEQLFAVIVSN
jgi:hypothetical protein